MSYDGFLARKRREWTGCGVTDIRLPSTGLYPFQARLTEWALRKGRAALWADTGLGKALADDERVLTPDGWREIRKISIGDLVYGRDGRPTEVLGVYPQGERELYRVTLSDGASIVCDAEHLWTVNTKLRRSRGLAWRTLTLHQLLAEGLRDGAGWRHFVPVAAAAERPDASLPVDPYTLGVLLGDGSLRDDSVAVTGDVEVVRSLVLPGQVTAKLYKAITATVGTYSLRVGRGYSNPLVNALRALGLAGKRSWEKSVPTVYLHASAGQRLAILAGLMDTDGEIAKDGHVEFSSTSAELARNVAELARSLGGVARIRSRSASRYTHRGERRVGRPSWRVTLTTPACPFRMSRKVARWRPRVKYQAAHAIAAVVPIGRGPATCIRVASSDGLFVVSDYIVTHNTRMQVAWAANIPGRVLILAPLCVAPQTIAEARAIGVSVAPLGAGERIEITNYERLHHVTPGDYTGIVLDESSCIKAVDSKTRTRLIEAFRETSYRLCCTATPAPNDIAELANHCEFLGIMTRAEMLATFFVHDEDGWRLKGHAHEVFYRWLASWGMFLRRPSDLGFSDDGYVLPPLDIQDLVVPMTGRSTGEYLFPGMGLGGLRGRLNARRDSLKLRVDAAVQLVESTPGPWLVWCGLNAEQDAIADALDGDCVSIAGSDSLEDKQSRIEAFIRGEVRVAVSKASIMGFGLNLQHCAQMAFVGIGDSYETYYQAIRRCWRFGQRRPVTVHVVVSDAETEIVANVRHKELEATRLAEGLVRHMAEAEREEIGMTTRQRATVTRDVARGDGWTLHLGDCVEVLRDAVGDASIDLSLYSPPFIALYTYTNSERDIGNSSTREEFFEHFGYVVRELLRVTKPGRLTCCHLSQVPAMKARDGYIGMKDMRGPTVALFEREGWVYQGEVVIDKDPQAQAIRVRAKGLAFQQLRKDASWMRPALADYILLFRKPGDNAVPILPDITNEDWIEWARPIWYGIRESDTLNVREARADDDDRHICPLQLGTIERCVRLWSNPGEVVLSPFAGIGSEGYEALQRGRRFLGIELKREYFEAAARNLAAMEQSVKRQLRLGDSEGW